MKSIAIALGITGVGLAIYAASRQATKNQAQAATTSNGTLQSVYDSIAKIWAADQNNNPNASPITGQLPNDTPPARPDNCPYTATPTPQCLAFGLSTSFWRADAVDNNITSGVAPYRTLDA